MYVVIPLAILVTLIIILTKRQPTPTWVDDPCSLCGGFMRWLKGHDTLKDGEAKFRCKACGNEEHRGGPYSEITLQHWESKK